MNDFEASYDTPNLTDEWRLPGYMLRVILRGKSVMHSVSFFDIFLSKKYGDFCSWIMKCRGVMRAYLLCVLGSYRSDI